jgi:PAS domain S-box-containing protein
VAKEYPIPGWYTWHIGRDVTENKQTEKKSREHEILLAAALEATKLGICFTDDRGRFLQVNRAYAELYGYRPEEMIGQPFTLILPSNAHGDAVRNYYNLLMTQEEPTVIRQENEVHRSGKVINVQVMASRIILEDRRRLLVSIVGEHHQN